MKTRLIFREELKEKILKVCKDISERDPTFKFESNGDIIIYSDNEKKAFARGMWMKQKIHSSIKFEVENGT